MSETVFYAWQSDLPNNVNRGFIHSAIERAVEAINADLGLDEALRPDSDTQGIPGNVNVAETIFEKVAACRVFIADITTVTPKDAARPSPNPNVLIEYGRACVQPGDSAVITVFNTAYGDWEKDRPFDMRHRRKPITYCLAPGADQGARQAARKQLVSELRRSIESCLAAPARNLKPPESAAFAAIQHVLFDSRRHEKFTGKAVAFWCGLIPGADNVKLNTPWTRADLFDRRDAIAYSIAPDATPIRCATLDSQLEKGTVGLEPVQGGAVLTSIRSVREWDGLGSGRMNYVVTNTYVNDRGHIGLLVRTNVNEAKGLSVCWIMAEMANALRVMDAVRKAAGVPLVPYHLYAEALAGSQSREWIAMPQAICNLWDLADENGIQGRPLRRNPTVVAPSIVSQSSEFGAVLDRLFIEFETSVGRAPKAGVAFQLDGA